MLKRCFTIILSALILAFPIFAFAESADSQPNRPSQWAQAEVQQAISLNLVPDEMRNAYDKPTNRQEFCRLIIGLCDAWHAAGKTDTAEQIASSRGVDLTETKFSDTTDPAVSLCAALGIVSGRGSGIFDPGASITRQEAARILYQAADDLTNINSGDPETVPAALYPHVFADGALIQSFARNTINWVYHMGIMQGISSNTFDPGGIYTHEQTYLTILRLYNTVVDPSKNKLPEPEYYPYGDGYIDSNGDIYTKEQKGYIYPFDQEYEVVLDNPDNIMNPGCHIIDQKGRTLLTDFKDTNGHFSYAIVSGNFAMLTYDGAPTIYVVNLKTGATYENAQLGFPSGGMALFSVDQKYGYFNSSGDVAIKPQYKDAGDFFGGKAVVQKQDGNWDVIDNSGKVIKANFFDTKKYTVMSNREYRLGEIVIVQNSNNKCAVFQGTKGLLTGFDYDRIACCSSGQFLGYKGNDQYVLLNKAGKQISKIYQDEIRELDNSCYLSYSSDPDENGFYSFTMIDQTGKEILISEMYGKNIHVDGGGLYVYQKDNAHCNIVDSQGSTIGSIERKYTIGEFAFINGLVYVTNSEKQLDDNDACYYHFDGTPLF
ncbi:MAG: S-layer homology domain-containing protein [Eubacteriales bacterium]|nr:S-layer homology domain-containing protein [Eubacteriales bacterium]